MSAVIDAVNVTKTYGDGDARVHALRGLSLKIGPGDYVAIIGASGSGKSTLMHILGCLDIPSSGRYLLDGIDVQLLGDRQLSLLRNRKIGFVFQSYNLVPRMSALQNEELPLAYGGVSAAARRRRALAALEIVGLTDRLRHEPSELSGGQQQRVAIARALIKDPILVLADEPTGELDSRTGDEIYRILRRLQIQRQATLVVVTHDRRFITPDDLVLEIQDGQLKAGAELEPQNDLAEAEVGLETLLGGNNVLEGEGAVQDRANKPTS
jgi:putative ABC transport system ATP-binding protein